MTLAMLFSFKTWIARLYRGRRRPIRNAPLAQRRSFRPALEQLEDRLAPATGTLTFNSLNQGTTLSVYRDNGAGSSGWLNNTTAGLFNLTYTDNQSVATNFNTFCIDLFNFASTGQTWNVDLRNTVTTAYTNGGQMANILQRYGQGAFSNNQAAALQLALWDLSLSNHTPTSFTFNSGTGYYDSGDSVFQVNFGSNSEAGNIASLVNTYLASATAAPAGSWFDGAAADPDKQHFIMPQLPPSLAPACPCDCPKTGALPQTAPNQAENPSQFSAHPVRYVDGVVKLAWSDLYSDGFGFGWGQTRNWTNGPGYASRSVNGSGMVDTEQPFLLQADGSSTTIAVVASGTDAEYFDLSGGVYGARFFSQNKLTYDSGTDVFTFVDTTGNQIKFHGFGTGLPAQGNRITPAC